MANGYSRQIQERIGTAAEGTVFVNSDFADIADTETIRRNLNRLTQAGTLRRILKGVYEKPEYSEMLKEYVAADPEAVAKALNIDVTQKIYFLTRIRCADGVPMLWRRSICLFTVSRALKRRI